MRIGTIDVSTTAQRRRTGSAAGDRQACPPTPASPAAERLLALQRSAGNRAVAGALTAARSRSTPRWLQRDPVDITGIAQHLKAMEAYQRFDQLDQPAAAGERVVTSRQTRLLERFTNTPATTLRIAAGAVQGGALATTSLAARTTAGAWHDPDVAAQRGAFDAAIAAGTVDRFIVRIVLRQNAIANYNAGDVLQALTHELTVHAEPILDFICEYWQRRAAGLPGAMRLLNVNEEHLLFSAGLVERYEAIRARTASDFSRHASDVAQSAPPRIPRGGAAANVGAGPSGPFNVTQASLWQP